MSLFSGGPSRTPAAVLLHQTPFLVRLELALAGLLVGSSVVVRSGCAEIFVVRVPAW
jgi:hypothetical protein